MVLFVITYFLQTPQLRLESVLFQIRVGQHTSYAVFRETMGLDAQIPEHCQDGTVDISVTFQFHDYQITGIILPVSVKVMEMDVKVNSQALALSIVDQRDTVKLVLYRRMYFLQVPADLIPKEIIHHYCGTLHIPDFICLYVLRRDQDAFLLCALMVILGLDLQKSIMAVHIGTDTHLLSRSPSVMVLQIIETVLCIPVRRLVTGNAASAMELGIIVSLTQFQKPYQTLLGCHEFGICTVHQTNFLHLLQSYRLQLFQQFPYTLVGSCCGSHIL